MSTKTENLDYKGRLCYNTLNSKLLKASLVGHQGRGTRKWPGGPFKPTMIRFDVSVLIQAQLGASLPLNVDTGPQHLADLEVDFLHGDVQAIRVQGGLFVQGIVESQLRLECVRCLKTFVVPVALDLEETFRLPGTDPEPDGTYAVGDDDWLDLAPLLREQTWVAIPMKPLCHSDCKGLCPQCGVNLNIESCTCAREKVDPRLALLKELMD